MSRNHNELTRFLRTFHSTGLINQKPKGRPSRRLFEFNTFRLDNSTLEVRQLLSGTDPNPPTAWTTQNNWGGGYQAEISVTNRQTTWIDDYQFQFDLADNITSIWGGHIVSHVGTRYTVAPESYATKLESSATAKFGFVATGSTGPLAAKVTNPLLKWNLDSKTGSTGGGSVTPPSATTSVIVAYNVTSTWTGGYNAEIKITNSSTSTITGWQLKMDTTNTISSVWNSTLTGPSTGSVTIKDAGWNGTLTPGASATIGLSANGPSNVYPSNYFFNGSPVNVTNNGGTSGGGGVVAPPVTTAPNKPTIRVDAVIGGAPNTYEASFAIWSGTQATKWSLYENGNLIYSANISTNTTGSQTATTQISRAYGASKYEVVVENGSGTTRSDALVRVFGGASPIRIASLDPTDSQAASTIISQGATVIAFSNLNAPSSTTFQAYTNTPDVVKVSISIDGKLHLDGLKAGRASVMIKDSVTGEARWFGVTVRNADGTLPGWPSTVALGSVSEDTPSNLAFWRSYESPVQNKQMDIRYIYLNGGPVNGWRTWSSVDGERLTTYIRESQKLGVIPYFVWYNIPDGGESYTTDLQHIQDPAYMKAYFTDLKFTLETIKSQSSDWPVGLLLEPDFLGYMMQNSGKTPDQISAVTSAVYDSGLLNANTDPAFANNVSGLVKAINFSIHKITPAIRFGWQVNLWASPNTPGNGIIKATDTMGWAAGRQKIADTANSIADYYKSAGILDSGANFVSIDKYGLDAGAQNGAAANPANSTWFWNADHWSNYLLFAKTLHTNTNLPITLWQLPVGHINGTTTTNPYDVSGKFTDLNNTTQHYEDSAPSYFFGDTFTTTASRASYFGTNMAGDPDVSVSGTTVSWNEHINEALSSGITTLLFGAGVGDSTTSVGTPPTDGYWWITKAEAYLKNPILLSSTNAPPVVILPAFSTSSTSIAEGQSGTKSLNFTVSLSSASSSTITMQYATNDISAKAGSDYLASNGTLTFAPGEKSKTISVIINGDTDYENDESFGLTLTNAINATISTPSVTGLIINDDTAPAPPLPTLVVNSVSVNEGNSGTVPLVYTVTLSAASVNGITVNYSTSDGTATNGTDYIGTSGVINFNPGELIKTISVNIYGDTTYEPDETFKLTISGAVGAIIASSTGTGTIINDDANPIPPATGNSIKQVVGYFAEWGIYGRQYNISDVPVDKLTVLNYAFAQINSTGEVGLFDSYAAVEKIYPGDTWDQPVKGNFNQITKLKAANPNLKVEISVGGWTLSSAFSDAALTDSSRKKFADSLVRFVNQYGFDGADLDWEYPVSGGLDTNKNRPEDKHNYTLLLQAVRSAFNAQEAISGKHYLLTVASPAGYDKMANFELADMAKSLDWFNVMSYDYHGAWETQTGHNAPLYVNPASQNAIDTKYNIDYTMQAYAAAGVPKEKLIMGAPLYGRTWQGVAAGPNGDGLFQNSTGAGAGTWEPGMIDYNDLLNKLQTQPATYKLYRDNVSQVPYVYAPGVGGGWFSTFEDKTSLGKKIDSIIANDYGGMMFWELDGDVHNSNSPDSLVGYAASQLKSNQPTLPSISATDVSLNEGNSGTSLATVTLTLSKMSDKSISVTYATLNGTATIVGNDYKSATGLVTFAPGETMKTVNVTINGDTVNEADETFQLNLSNATNANLLKSVSTITIKNDDSPAAPPASSGAAVLAVTGTWFPGFGGEITVKNTTGSNISSGWVLEFDSNFDITSIWNADIVSHIGTRYTVKSLSWNGSLANGGTLKFGFNGTMTGGSTTPGIIGSTIRKA